MEEGSLPIRVRFEPVIEMTSDLFEQFSALNDDMRIELTAEGMIELMPPAFGVTSSKNSIIAIQLGNWTLQDGNGVSFDSSGGFTLPNSAVRSPDASWVSNVRYNSLTVEEKNSFTPLCPDFVVELRSSSDRLTVLQAKMDEYIEGTIEIMPPANGATKGRRWSEGSRLSNRFGKLGKS
jgi:Uma2 family endonuclease